MSPAVIFISAIAAGCVLGVAVAFGIAVHAIRADQRAELNR